ncbi:MAG: hypothetical protein QXT63_02280 [Thermoplasmata archaeon]
MNKDMFILATSNLQMQIFKLRTKPSKRVNPVVSVREPSQNVNPSLINPSLIYSSYNKQKYSIIEKSENGEWIVIVSKREIRILKLIKEKIEAENTDNKYEEENETPLPINCT